MSALSRIENAIQREGSVLGQLCADLAEMADAIAQAKAALELAGAAEPAASEHDIRVRLLLEQLEGRINGLIDMVGVARARLAPAPAESVDPSTTPVGTERHQDSGRVPTVSNVVSRLGRADAASANSVEPRDRAPPGSDDAPSVSMLEAMVEALAAQVPDMPAAPAPETISSRAANGAPRAPASPGNRQPTLSPETAPDASGSVEPSADLMSNFKRMSAIPFLPPEIGTAVIFTPRPPPAAAPDPPPSKPAPATSAEAGSPPASAAEPEADPDAFLFDPAESESDVAAFLFEEAASDTGIEPDRAESPAAGPAAAAPAVGPAPAPADEACDATAPTASAPETAPPYDPLAPLKSMSDEEKIALFT